MFWIIYLIGLISWFVGWLPISGWWFIAIPFLLPFIFMFVTAMLGAGLAASVGGLFGIAILLEKLEERKHRKGRELLNKRRGKK